VPKARFSDPPITEVVCGVLFEHVEGLDPVLVGRFWQSQSARFPRKQLLPAIIPLPAEGLVFDLGPVPPLRTWLISADDTRVMQLQADRFYLNWRSMGTTAYPSFNQSDGQVGLLTEVLEAFSGFATFLRECARVELRPTNVELTMIDVLKQGRHWASLSDLRQVLPLLEPFLLDLEALPRVLQTHVEGPIKQGERRVVIQRARLADTGGDAIRVETTARLPVSSVAEVERALKEGHGLLKRTFDELIPNSEHHRFELGWRPRA
jgi:uncharacterized protein (TIGR04255 family)